MIREVIHNVVEFNMISAQKKIEMPLDWELYPAEFIERPNRFLTRVKFEGNIVESHLPDPGRLKELLLPHAKLLIKKEHNPNRKTKFSTQAVWLGDELISINSWLPNQFVHFMLLNQLLPFLNGFEFVKREITVGKNRFDFLVQQGKIKRYIEVKSVTLVENGVAKFPDAVTERGARHVKHLSEMIDENIECMVLFVVQRSDASKFSPQWERDPIFSQTILDAYKNGLKVNVINIKVEKDKLTYLGELPFNLSHN